MLSVNSLTCAVRPSLNTKTKTKNPNPLLSLSDSSHLFHCFRFLTLTPSSYFADPWEHVVGMGLGAVFVDQLVKWDAKLQEDLDKMLEKAKAANERRYFGPFLLLSSNFVTVPFKFPLLLYHCHFFYTIANFDCRS